MDGQFTFARTSSGPSRHVVRLQYAGCSHACENKWDRSHSMKYIQRTTKADGVAISFASFPMTKYCELKVWPDKGATSIGESGEWLQFILRENRVNVCAKCHGKPCNCCWDHHIYFTFNDLNSFYSEIFTVVPKGHNPKCLSSNALHGLIDCGCSSHYYPPLTYI